MDPIVIKPGDLQAFILALAALLTAAGVIGGYISKAWTKIRKPETRQDAKLEEHEAKIAEHDARIREIQLEIEAAKRRQEETNKSEKAMQKVLLALVDYNLEQTEETKKGLQDARDALRDYLLNK